MSSPCLTLTMGRSYLADFRACPPRPGYKVYGTCQSTFHSNYIYIFPNQFSHESNVDIKISKNLSLIGTFPAMCITRRSWISAGTNPGSTLPVWSLPINKGQIRMAGCHTVTRNSCRGRFRTWEGFDAPAYLPLKRVRGRQLRFRLRWLLSRSTGHEPAFAGILRHMKCGAWG